MVNRLGFATEIINQKDGLFILLKLQLNMQLEQNVARVVPIKNII